jgi:hypothetical protein
MKTSLTAEEMIPAIGQKSNKTAHLAAFAILIILAIWMAYSTILFVVDQYSPVLHMDQWSSYSPDTIINNIFGRHNGNCSTRLEQRAT